MARDNPEGQVKYCRGTLFGHAKPDRAGARPYRAICARTRKGSGPPLQVVSDTCVYFALSQIRNPFGGAVRLHTTRNWDKRHPENGNSALALRLIRNDLNL